MLVQAMNICFLTGKTTQFATLAPAGGVTAMQWAMTLPLAVVGRGGRGLRRHGYATASTRRPTGGGCRGALYVIAGILVAQYVYRW